MSKDGPVVSFFWASDDASEGHADIHYQAYVKVTYNCGKCGVNLPEGAYPGTSIRCSRGHLNDVSNWSGQVK